MDEREGYSALSKDDEQATRIASLALAFMSSDTISDDTIWHSFYPDLTKPDSCSTRSLARRILEEATSSISHCLSTG